MANINLGNIRKLGFIRGLADAELARQAAEAKIAEEDRAYQRLLERDEALRKYQSGEAEKGRVFQADQAKTLAKATKEAADKKAKENNKRKIENYITLCHDYGTENLWNSWCSMIAAKYPTDFIDGNHVSEVHYTYLTGE